MGESGGAKSGRARETQAQKLRRQQRELLVKQAIGKQQQGAALTQAELRAFDAWERERDEERGLRFLEQLPKKFWCDWSGRQHRTLTEQAKLYGIPLDGKTLDVRAVAKWLHDFLAKYRQPLSELVKQSDSPEGVAKTLQGQKTAEQVTQLRLRNQRLETQILAEREQFVSRELIHAMLTRGAHILRGAGDRLYKKHGKEAGDMLARALDDFQRLIDELDGSTSDHDREPPVDRESPG